MIKIESIIKNLNIHIDNTRTKLGIQARGHIVLHKTILNNPTFKVYKDYNIIVYYIQGKNKKELINIKETNRSLPVLLDIGYNNLLREVFNLISSDLFEKILKGE